LGKYKENFQKKYGKINRDIKPAAINQVKQKVDKILESFKKRVTYKKNYYRPLYLKEVDKRYNETDVSKSFSDLLEYAKFLNNNIVPHFVNNMRKSSDLKKALEEAETGFTPKLNALDFGTNLFNTVKNYYDKIFNTYEDLKFKLEDKGYFTEIYNEYNAIKEPNVQDLKELRADMINKINETCDYIEKTLISEIDKVKQKFNTDNIKGYLETEVKK
jgi:hypothetical protein